MVRKFGTPVELPGDPADDLHAAPKQYVDTGLAGKSDTGHDHTGTYQPLDSDLTTIAGLTATTDSILQSKSSAWTTRTPAQFKTDLALVKGDVGLGNVDNTSDASKPVSTATQTALDAKVPTSRTLTASTGLTGGGDLSANRSFAVSYGSSSGTAVQGDDSRVTADQAAGTASIRTLGGGAQQAAPGNHDHDGPAYVGTLFSNQTISSGSWNALSFGSEEIDTDSGHSTVTNPSRYTIPTTGLYYVAAGAYIYGGTGGSTRAITIAWNGSNLNYAQYNGPGNDAVTISTIPVILSLSAGDYVEAKVYQNSGSNRTALAAQTSMMVSWVRGA